MKGVHWTNPQKGLKRKTAAFPSRSPLLSKKVRYKVSYVKPVGDKVERHSLAYLTVHK